VEAVVARTGAVWCDLLGEDRFKLAERMARDHAESVDAASTRLWTALECLKKIGQPVQSPLVLESSTDDGWTLLRSGTVLISTCVTAVRGVDLPLSFAVARDAARANPTALGGAKTGV
jgi:enediyne polyketide synthase